MDKSDKQSPVEVSTVIFNGKFFTNNFDGEALAIEKELIIFIGSNQDIKKYIRDNTNIMDASRSKITLENITNNSYKLKIDDKIVWENLEIKNINRNNQSEIICITNSNITIDKFLKTTEKTWSCLGAYTTLPDFKWKIEYYFKSITGSEHLYLYIWALKDLSWMQCWLVPGWIFGIMALLWSSYHVIFAIIKKNMIEAWHYMGQLFWLLGNFVWMYGEIHDENFLDEPQMFDFYKLQSGYILKAALAFMVIYYAFIFPCKLFNKSCNNNANLFNSNSIKNIPSWITCIIPDGRCLENMHIVFWLCKDVSWNASLKIPWIISSVPTILLALLFVIYTSFQRGKIVLHVHSLFQLNWVLANIIWAIVELWGTPKDDIPVNLFKFSDGVVSLRWWSSWMILVNFFIITMLYIFWFSIYCCIEEKSKYGEEIEFELERKIKSIDNLNN